LSNFLLLRYLKSLIYNSVAELRNMKKFLVKAAWIADHDSLGRVLSLLVTAYRETSPNSYGYSLSDDLDEVIIVPTYFNKAVEILPKMDKIGTKQFWKKAAFGDIAEIQLNMDDFFDNYTYQNEWNREVLFHTYKELL
ncbi:MAG: hypothetical protein UE783_03505, partial [Prevotella sp.]|nr:hypothetical protein [Prevotella sp.]